MVRLSFSLAFPTRTSSLGVDDLDRYRDLSSVLVHALHR
jgi:hypothetical protein